MFSVLIAYSKTSHIQIAALVYFLLAGALTQVPLFNYLGYEFSALMTIPTALISGILTIQFLREHNKKPLTRRTWLYVVVDYLTVNALLLLIPLIVILLNAFVVKNCAFAKGFVYYLLLPVCAMIFSVSLALVVGTIFRHALFIFTLLVVAILSHVVLITYTEPQLFAYNFILGFFPGITYDESLSDLNLLILYREFTVIAALMLIGLFLVLLSRYSQKDKITVNLRSIKKSVKKDKLLWLSISVCFFTLATGHVYRDDLGFEYSEKYIQNELGRRTESDHFIFYYSGGDYNAQEMQRLKAEAEFHFNKVKRALRIQGNNSKKIETYIYPNGEWKQRFIGTSTTNIAKPWKRQIHLTAATFESTFRHELVHALAADFGFPIIRASTLMGLNEGLAVAVDWDEGIFSPHQFAAAIQRENGLEHVSQLFTYTGFAVQSSSYAYLVSGSFSRYLIERFGIERYKRLFANGNFVFAFGETLENLLKGWKAYLKTIDTSGLPTETVRSLFFQQSIFYKTCAREIAEQNKRAVQAIRVKDYSTAETEFNASYSNAPTVFALRGIFQTLISQRRWKEVLQQYQKLPENSSVKHHPAILLFVGDAYYLNNETQNASIFYEKIRKMNYSESFIEASAIRMQSTVEKIDPEFLFTIYYSGDSDSIKSSKVEQLQKSSPQASVLKFFNALLLEKESMEGAEDLRLVTQMQTSDDIKYFSASRAAKEFFGKHRFEETKSMLWQAKNTAPTATLSEQLDEQIELCDFVSIEMQ